MRAFSRALRWERNMHFTTSLIIVIAVAFIVRSRLTGMNLVQPN